MIFRDRRMTATEAATQFATEAFEEARRVGRSENRNGLLYFRLVGGTQTYCVQPIPDGWQVTAELARN